MRHEALWRDVRVYTIGHSTRSLDELVALLREVGVTVLVDIRTVPRSRHNPQFNADALAADLPARGIGYVHLRALGGLRHARKDSINTGWRNASFRGYADYMQTDGFEGGLESLHELATNHRVALMCAEAVPWRCHRSLVADVLTVRGAEVEHIVAPGKRPSRHRITPFARVEGEHVTYPGEQPEREPEQGDPKDGDRLATRAPFHLEATVRVLQRRPSNLVDRWEDGRYLRVLPSASGLVLVEVEERGTIDAPDPRIDVRIGSAEARAEITRIVRKILGLDVDPAPLQRLAEAERRLRPTAIALRGMRPPRFAALFEAFANVIPFQQVSLDAGVAIVGRLVERFGERVEDGGRRYHAFPTADRIAGARVTTLRSCGLSARKAEALRAAARAVATGELTEERLGAMSTPDALEALTELSGIGPWSAGLVLLRGMRRLDVFPAGDVGVERGLRSVLRLAPEASLGRVIERFGDLRGYLYFCSLGASLLAKGLIHAAPATSGPRPKAARRARSRAGSPA